MASVGFISNTWAESSPAGVIIVSKGTVEALGSGSQSRALSRGSEIYSGDEITTAANSEVQIRFTDNGIVSLKPNAAYRVNSYEFKGPADKKANLTSSLLKGKMLALTGEITKENPKGYTVKTKLSTIGITGTEFATELTRDVQTLEVFRGTVIFSARGGSINVGENAPYSAAMVTSASGVPVGFKAAPAFFSKPYEASKEDLENLVYDSLMKQSFYDSYRLGLDEELLSEKNPADAAEDCLDADLVEEGAEDH